MKIKIGIAAVILGLSVLSAENSDVNVLVNMKKAIVKLIGETQENNLTIKAQGIEIQELKEEINNLKNALNIQVQPVAVKQQVLKEYVVNTMNLNIRKEPTEYSEQLGTLTIGTRINSTVNDSGWLKLENGGYVKKDYLSETTTMSIRTIKRTKVMLIPTKRNEYLLKEVDKNTKFNVVAKVLNNQWLLLDDGNYIKTANSRKY